MGKKQLEIVGIERKQIKEVNDGAEAYQEVKNKRMALTKKEKEAKNALIAVMKKHNVEIYRDDDASPPLVVTLTPGVDDVKVREVATDEEKEEAA